MEIFEHPFAILTAVFFFQVGTELAYQPAASRWRDAACVLVALAGVALAASGSEAFAGLVALMYGCLGGFLLGFFVTSSLYGKAVKPTPSRSGSDRVNDR